MAETIRVGLRVDDALDELKKVLRRMPMRAKVAMRDASSTIAERETDEVKSAADRESKQARMAAASVRYRRGETPTIAAGGALTVRTGARGGRVTGSDVFFGSEFGGRARSTTQQFPPHRGREGYWFWPTLRGDADSMLDEWATALDAVAQVWSD